MSKTFSATAQHFFHPEPDPRRTRIIPVFLPFAGCLRPCVFCAQDIQTGKAVRRIADILTDLAADVPQRHSEYCAKNASPERNSLPELAFYGGTFTSLIESDFSACLELAAAWKREGRIASARCSTRPDALSPEILFRLKAAGFTTIELGVQSFNTLALRHAGRGYTEETVVTACKMVQDAGLSLGIQLMPGMPGLPASSWTAPSLAAPAHAGAARSAPSESTLSDPVPPAAPPPSLRELWEKKAARHNPALAAALEDAEKAAALKPEIVRLYPCLVFEGTALAELWRQGRYIPLRTEEAVLCLAEACRIFWRAGVRVVRMGVAPEDGLEAGMLAGPAHPALGNRARALALFSFIAEQRAALFPAHKRGSDSAAAFRLTVPRRRQGELFGHRKELVPLYESIGIARENILFHEDRVFLLSPAL